MSLKEIGNDISFDQRFFVALLIYNIASSSNVRCEHEKIKDLIETNVGHW